MVGGGEEELTVGGSEEVLMVGVYGGSPGGPKFAAKIGPSLPKTTHLRVLHGFTSIVEAIGFPNRRHQQSIVSERVQQESDVLKKAYTHRRK